MVAALLLVLAGSLAACTQPSSGQPQQVVSSNTPAIVVTDTNAVVHGLQGMLAQLVSEQPALIPPDALAKIDSALADADAATGKLSAGLAAVVGATQVQIALGDINAVLDAMAAPPINGLLPPPYNEAVAAAALLAPGMEAFVQQNLANNTAAVSLDTLATRVELQVAALEITTPDQALAVLQRYVAH
jgi:hypothetical protein